MGLDQICIKARALVLQGRSFEYKFGKPYRAETNLSAGLTSAPALNRSRLSLRRAIALLCSYATPAPALDQMLFSPAHLQSTRSPTSAVLISPPSSSATMTEPVGRYTSSPRPADAPTLAESLLSSGSSYYPHHDPQAFRRIFSSKKPNVLCSTSCVARFLWLRESRGELRQCESPTHGKSINASGAYLHLRPCPRVIPVRVACSPQRNSSLDVPPVTGRFSPSLSS
jgi:hypothetical protein